MKRVSTILAALAMAAAAAAGSPVRAEPGGDADDFWGELAQPGYHRYRQQVDEGRRLAAQEPPRWAPAIRAFEKAVALLPGRPEAHLELGRAHQRTQQCAPAITHLERALASGLPPFEARGALLSLGDCRRRRGEYSGALQSYAAALERVLAARHHARDEALRQARIEVARGWRPASRPVAQNPTLDAEEVELRRRVADTLVSLGRLDDAEASYREGLGIDSRHPLSWLGLGVTLILKEQVADGEEALKRALQGESSETRLITGGGVLEGDPVQAKLLGALLALARDRLGEALVTLRGLVGNGPPATPHAVQLRGLLAELEARQKAAPPEKRPVRGRPTDRKPR
jgi:tetratricopeptide (TPR) repeat protein